MAEYVREEFTRADASGWGTAPIGGAWTENHVQTTAQIISNLGRVNFNVSQAGAANMRLAAATAAADAMCSCSVVTRVQWYTAGTWSTSVSVWARVSGATATPAGYYCKAEFKNNGALRLSLGRGDGTGALTELTATTFAGFHAQDQTFRVELQVYGSTINGRIYRTNAIPGGLNGWITTSDETITAAGVYHARFERTTPPSAFNQAVDVADVYWTDVPAPAFTTAAGGGIRQIQFTSSGTGDPTSYAWAFGDGTTGTGNAPLHTFPTAGSYNVTLTITTRWAATFAVGRFVAVSSTPPPGYQLRPLVLVNGVDVCDDVYSVSWGSGSDHWTDTLTGQTATLQLRGRYAVTQGQSVTITAPTDPTAPLFVGIVDQVTDNLALLDAGDTTSVVAMDYASLLARQHLAWSTILPRARLAGRLGDLVPSGSGVSYRAKWSGIASVRYPELQKKVSSAGASLRERTFLDMVNEALNASMAFAYTARDGAIVYGAWDGPSQGGSVPTSPVLNLDTGLDCGSSADVDRTSMDGIVNRWTYGDGDSIDVRQGSSIQAYGERQYSTPAGTLYDFTFWPITTTTTLVQALDDPATSPTVEVPIVDATQKSITVEPMDLARFEGVLYAILGVRHEAGYSQPWKVTLTLDRNPWAVYGATPPV